MDIKFEPIAITGYGCVFPPDSYDVDKFWNNVINNTAGIKVVPEKYWEKEIYFDTDKQEQDKTYCKLGGCVDEYQFNNHNLEDVNIRELNKTQLMVLDTILQAVENGYLSLKALEGKDTALIVGNMLGDSSFANFFLVNRGKQIINLLEKDLEFKKVDPDVKTKIYEGLIKSLNDEFLNLGQANTNEICNSTLAKAISDILKIEGPSFIVDGACSGSVLAIDEAIKHLHTGAVKTAIVSGVLGNMLVTGNIAFSKIGGLSEYGSFPLDSDASGLVPSEGAGTVILKTLSNALADNNKIFAVIRGSAATSDGKGKSIYAPSSSGQYLAMKKSLDKAGMKASEIDYIETHATGTKVGDKVELTTIKELFSETNHIGQTVIGSIKSQIGHSFSAAGMANLIKVLEGMKREQFPPTHNIKNFVMDDMLSDGHFCINSSLSDWNKNGKPVMCASINAFGFGGINANVLIESYDKEYHQNILNHFNVSNHHTEDIAIVGIGCIDGNASSYNDWENSHVGLYKTEYPIERFGKGVDETFNSDKKLKAAFIDKINFPCLRFKVPPKILEEVDRAQQLGLMATYEAVEDYGSDKIAGERTCIYVANMLGLESSLHVDQRIRHREYKRILNKNEDFNNLDKELKKSILEEIEEAARVFVHSTAEDTLPGYMDNIIAGRIANYFDISGVNCVIDADSCSFPQALKQSMLGLTNGEYDTAIIGGVHGNLTPEFISLCEKLSDENYVPAEGAAFFILKRVNDVQDGEHVYGVITGVEQFGSERTKMANDIYDSDSLKTSDGLSYFYFGAQGAFQLLDVCSKFENQKQSDVFSIVVNSAFSGGYTIDIAESVIKAKKLEKKKDIQDKNAPSINNENDDIKTFYTAANSLEDFIENIVTSKHVNNDNLRSYKYKIAIVYKNEKELAKKIELVKKCIQK